MTDAQIAGGHKATINNPNTSQEAKEHSKKVLHEEFNDGNGKELSSSDHELDSNKHVSLQGW
jgi:hypothetical protein